MNTPGTVQHQRDLYLDQLRGASILRVMLGHLGLLWFFPPYSFYFGALLPVLFYVSGAVSLGSFQRAGTPSSFLLHRAIAILTPFYLFFVLVVAWGLLRGTPVELDAKALTLWLATWPERHNAYTPIKHTWYINALLVITLIAIPVLIRVSRSALYAVIPSVLIFLLTGLASAGAGRDSFLATLNPYVPDYAHQLWACLVMLPFFLMGTIHPATASFLRSTTGGWCCVGLLALAVTYMASGEKHSEFAELLKQRDFGFIAVSALLLALLLRYQAAVQRAIVLMPGVSPLLMFASKHAIGLFLLHIVVLNEVESLFGWRDLSANPALALLRLVLVSVLTFLLAPAFSNLSRWLVAVVKRTVRNPLRVRQPVR